MINDLLTPIQAPKVLVDAIHKMDNQRKIFNYIQLSPKDVNIDREISEDEINQYFADFGENFMIPEMREVELLLIDNDKIVNKYVATPEIVEDYFEQNKNQFDQPEKREILQMVFLNKESAQNALNEVENGRDFNEVAKELNAENADEPTLGIVAYDELAEGLADEAFGLDINTPKLIEVADSWQVIKVKDIIPFKKADFEEVKSEIITKLVEENMYDATREVRGIIDDAINAGKKLSDIGNEFETSPYIISNIKDGVIVDNVPDNLKSITNSLDFNELVFSYGLDEYSSAEEFDDGIVVLKVTNIVDEHMPEVNEVRDDIIKLWEVQEKNALAKEIAENILLEIEEGSDMTQVANARGLEVFRSEPISRNNSFANLYHDEISELFLLDNQKVKLFEKEGNSFVIAKPVETVTFNDELDENTINAIKERASSLLLLDMANSALKAYGEKLNIVIDYQKAGFSE